MDFIDQLKQFSKRVESLKESIQTEEATKTALIMPFFSMLGYDVFNPQEFVPEFTADVGIKKGEKVDYAIMKDGCPAILIECKSINEGLARHDSQLFRYFSTVAAKFAILTNGQFYKFYTDLDNPNKMDEVPFLTINLLELRDNQVPELKKFCKSSFDVDTIFSTASELKYVHQFKKIFSQQLDDPSDAFVRFFLQGCYSGQKTQGVLEQFRPLLQKALNDYISEIMNDKIKTALGGSGGAVSVVEQRPQEEKPAEPTQEKDAAKIVTTEEELEAFFIVKNLLREKADMSDITYKDTVAYMNILYKGNSRRRLCRLYLNSSRKIMSIPAEDKKDVQHQIENVYDIANYADELIAVLDRYLRQEQAE